MCAKFSLTLAPPAFCEKAGHSAELAGFGLIIFRSAFAAIFAMAALFAARQNPSKGCDQPLELDRLDLELVAARSQRLFTLAG